MLKAKFFFLIPIWIVWSCPVFSQPFSFTELEKQKVPLKKPSYIAASDGARLAYYPYLLEGRITGSLVFLHGGGAYSEGYQQLAGNLSDKSTTAVYLMDLRGHGNSEGPRGDAPSVEQVWIDVKFLIKYIKKHAPDKPVYLGGHSSGGGLVLNYSSWAEQEPVNGYIFLSPEFGYKSDTARTDIKKPFATPRTWVFILSALSGGNLFGHTKAVIFHYPAEIQKKHPLLLSAISRNMAVALTPAEPQKQFSRIDRPFGLFIGEKDELFQADKVIAYSKLAQNNIQKKSQSSILKGKSHLSVLMVADQWIRKLLQSWHS